MEISISNVKIQVVVDSFKIVAASIFLSLASQIAFTLPFTPVIATLQTAALFLIGITLGPTHAALSVLLYLLEGLLGLPVFAFGQSGIALLLGPKGGYYLGFCLTAFISGFAKKEYSLSRLFSIFVCGNAVSFLFGLAWLSLFVGMEHVLMLGFYPFILGDLFKICAAIACIKGCSWGLKPNGTKT